MTDKKSTEADEHFDEVIVLDYPIKYGEETVREVGLKRPKAKHLKNIVGKTEPEQAFNLAVKLSGRPPSFFDEMDGSDFIKVAEVIGDFLGNGRKVGEAN